MAKLESCTSRRNRRSHPTALAIADEITSRYPDCSINFVGAKGRMEMTKVPSAGYEIEGMDQRYRAKNDVCKKFDLSFQAPLLF